MLSCQFGNFIREIQNSFLLGGNRRFSVWLSQRYPSQELSRFAASIPDFAVPSIGQKENSKPRFRLCTHTSLVCSVKAGRLGPDAGPLLGSKVWLTVRSI